MMGAVHEVLHYMRWMLMKLLTKAVNNDGGWMAYVLHDGNGYIGWLDGYIMEGGGRIP